MSSSLQPDYLFIIVKGIWWLTGTLKLLFMATNGLTHCTAWPADDQSGKNNNETTPSMKTIRWCHLGGWKLASTHCQMGCVMLSTSRYHGDALFMSVYMWAEQPICRLWRPSHASHVTQYLKSRSLLFRTMISIQHTTCFYVWWHFLMPPFPF